MYASPAADESMASAATADGGAGSHSGDMGHDDDGDVEMSDAAHEDGDKSDHEDGSSAGGSSAPTIDIQAEIRAAMRARSRRGAPDDIPPELLDFTSRRSARSRKAPERFVAPQYEDDEDMYDDSEPFDPLGASKGDDDEDEDEDSDFGRKASKRRRKTRRRSGGDEPHWDIPQRMSMRNVPRKQYFDHSSEEEEEEDYDEDEEMDAPPEPEVPEGDVIEKIVDYRNVDIEDMDYEDNTLVVREYLVKWKGWAHIHNTWCTKDYLKTFKGFKKVLNYEKLVEEDEHLRSIATAEDLEYLNIQAEERRTLHRKWLQVDRVVASREDEGGTQYFVLWKGLMYEECTWENANDISEFQNLIDEFLAREQQQFNTVNTKYKKERPRFTKIKQQPEWLVGGTLRDYQMIGLNWLAQLWCKNLNGILADEMGLGKTIQTVALLSWLQYGVNIPGPFLVVVPLSTLGNWLKEFRQWAPGMNVVQYVGNAASRKIIREYEFYNTQRKSRPFKINALVTTYDIVLKDQAMLNHINWTYLAVDEAHRLKNNESMLHVVLDQFKTGNRLLITGTPLQNSIRELWSLLHFLQPKKFSSLEDFEEEYADLQEQDKISNLHSELAPHILRRLKKDVEKSLPSKTERILRVQMSALQKTLYYLILERNLSQLNRALHGKGRKVGLINILVELRKCCNHPFLIDSAAVDWDKDKEEIMSAIVKNCGKLTLLHKLLVRLKETGHRVLIFSQMVRMLDILADYLRLAGFHFQRLDGSMPREARQSAMEQFNAPDSTDFCFLLSTRAGGLGINLSTADTVVIYDSDWNPQNDLQAVARAHRIGQTRTVNIYRLVTKDTVEEDIVERAKQKMVLDHLVIQQMETSGKSVLTSVSAKAAAVNKPTDFSKDDLNSILKFGARALFADEGEKGEGQEMEEMDIDEILARAETTETRDMSTGASELLSQFKVANFAPAEEEDDENFWNDLLPNGPKKDDAVPLYLGPRKRTNVNYAETHVTPAAEPLVGKKRKRQKGAAGASKKQKADSDGTMLTDKEVRALVRSFKKYGELSRLNDIVADCSLTHKKKKLLLDLLHELIALCTGAVKAKGSETKVQVEFHKQPVNAIDLVQRMRDMELLRAKVGSKAPNAASFRVNLKVRPSNIPDWVARHDSMLLLGAFRHGVGNWDAIRNDDELGFNTDESKMIKGVFLMRRLDVLFRALRSEKNPGAQSGGTRRRPGQAPKPSAKPSAKASAKPSTKQQLKKKLAKPGGTALVKPKGKAKARAPPAGGAAAAAEKKRASGGEGGECGDGDVNGKKHLYNIRGTLRKFRGLAGKELPDDVRLRKTKEYLTAIGNHIASEKPTASERAPADAFELALWNFVSTYVHQEAAGGEKLRSLYQKLK